MAIVLAVCVAACQAWLVHDLAQLPSPLFGGDDTYQMGCIQSIRDSGNPLASCSTSGALPGYLPLYGTLVALFSRLTGMPVPPSMLLCSILLRALSALLVFALFARAFGRFTALAMAGLWAALHPDLLIKYSDFTAAIVVPLYFHALVRFVAEPRPARAPWLGLVLAAAGYAHAVAFTGGLAIACLAGLAGALARSREHGLGRELAGCAAGLAVVLLCASLALGYWWRPLVVHHGHTSPHYTEWNGGVSLATAGARGDYTLDLFARLVYFQTWPEAALRLLFVLGLGALLRAGPRRRHAAGALCAAATLAWNLHYLATMPLLHTHFVPDYVRRLLWEYAVLLVAVVPVAWLGARLRPGAGTWAPAAGALALALVGLVAGTRTLAASPDMRQARLPLPSEYRELRRWALAHTRTDDVVLSTNELSFAWSALTGRKCVVTRRAQNDAFADMDARNRDAALILYGRDDALRRRLLARWRVDYLLWTTDWAPLEYRPGAGAGGYLDPLFWFYDP
ncbi:MAG TPA: hypothetical protein VGU27_12890, partial [Candidatus Eisenbacteria bacterium]|nr:hypothetical protein [Candidatus Eisenbacteria bacterium]